MKKLIDEVWLYVSFTLMLIGIVGLTWEALRDDGWFEQLAGKIWDAEVREPLLATPIVGGALLLVSIFLRGGLSTTGKEHPFGTLIGYALMASGAYFAFQYWRG